MFADDWFFVAVLAWLVIGASVPAMAAEAAPALKIAAASAKADTESFMA